MASKVVMFNLHSTMVRFIIIYAGAIDSADLDLHSTMVRFIIIVNDNKNGNRNRFTFHYGQIYYIYHFRNHGCSIYIYIPLWLDLLQLTALCNEKGYCIYIPLWLDLLCLILRRKDCWFRNLHSTMVRFIISVSVSSIVRQRKFTFHYGQIYYHKT